MGCYSDPAVDVVGASKVEECGSMLLHHYQMGHRREFYFENRLCERPTLVKIDFIEGFFLGDIMMLYSTLMPPHFELLFSHSFTLSIG